MTPAEDSILCYYYIRGRLGATPDELYATYPSVPRDALAGIAASLERRGYIEAAPPGHRVTAAGRRAYMGSEGAKESDR